MMEPTAALYDQLGYYWSLEKYARWDGNSWLQVDNNEGKLTLHLKNMQLLVINQDIAIESMGLVAGPNQICGVWKGDTLLITIKHQMSSRKFRVKFATSELLSNVLNCKECVEALQKYIPVYNTEELDSHSTFVSTSEWYKVIMSRDATERQKLFGYICPEPLLPEFPLEKTIELCLLDPSFPALVERVETFVQKYT